MNAGLKTDAKPSLKEIWTPHPYLNFILLGLFAYVAIEAAAEAAALLIVKGGPVLQDVAGGAVQALALWEIAVPYYALLGIICGSMAKCSGYKKAFILFGIGVFALGGLGFISARASQTALAQHAWTASALSYLVLMIYGLPVILACLAVRLIAGWKKRRLEKQNPSP